MRNNKLVIGVIIAIALLIAIILIAKTVGSKPKSKKGGSGSYAGKERYSCQAPLRKFFQRGKAVLP